MKNSIEMERRNFLRKSGCAAATFAAAPIVMNDMAIAQPQTRRRYKIDIDFLHEPGIILHFELVEFFE
jgi:hypothetical protein